MQWTPYGMGRRVADLPLLSRDTGVRVVCATGLHQAAHYSPELLESLRGRLAEVFVGELTEGIGPSGSAPGSSRSRAASTASTRTPAGR